MAEARSILNSQRVRGAAVMQMRANNAIEGLVADLQDLELQRRYIAGEIGIDHLLQAAHAYANRFMGVQRPLFH